MRVMAEGLANWTESLGSVSRVGSEGRMGGLLAGRGICRGKKPEHLRGRPKNSVTEANVDTAKKPPKAPRQRVRIVAVTITTSGIFQTVGLNKKLRGKDHQETVGEV